ncbi:MAG: dihydroorotase family protein [Chloroflexi bacterium]|nr:dihydroorotase family protein [Chloroflexota bacterium]
MSPGRADLVVRNGTVVSPDSMRLADIAIRGGRFVAIADRGALDLRALGLERVEEVDASGLHLLPGVIDGHVHFREPGLEHKEDWASGSQAAVMGGVTCVLEMPNTVPPTDSAENVRDKQRLAEGRSWVDFGLFGLLARGGLERIRPMAEAGVIGFKCFLGETTGALPAPGDEELLSALREAASLGLRVGFHAEDRAIIAPLVEAAQAAGRTDALAHGETRPIEAEVAAIAHACRLAADARAAIHVHHLSSMAGLSAVEAGRAQGVDITAEVTPHHLLLSTDDVDRLGGITRVNPPLRPPGEGAALVAALAAGDIEMVASDHAPHTRAEKSGRDVWQVSPGFSGVEILLPLLLTAVKEGRLTLSDVVRLTSDGPARAWGIYHRKGVIAVGSDADLTLVDLSRNGVIDQDRLHGKEPVTPFHGRPTVGAAVSTIVRGRVVMQGGRLVGGPSGRMVRP